MKTKKTLFVISSTIVSALPAVLLSCGEESYEYFYAKGGNSRENIPKGNELAKTANGEVVSFVTDGGVVNDKSFNEGTLNGVKKWSSKNSANTFKIYEIANGGKDHADYATAYQKAMASAASATMVLVGFKHTMNGKSTIDRLDKFVASNPNKKIIGIDIFDSNAGNKLYGITFKTEQSGFMTAVEIGYQLNKQFAKDKSISPIKVAAFGGVKISPVLAFMNGYAAGIKYFNANNGDLRDLELIHIDKNDLTKDFSGNFNPGGAAAIAKTLIDKGAKAIFAIAGVQTADVIEAIKESKKQSEVFAIGVDTDQSQVYGASILGSAFKGLDPATKAMLTSPTDKVYSLADNNGDNKYVGYIPNKYYKSDISSAQRTAAESAASVADAFNVSTWS